MRAAQVLTGVSMALYIFAGLAPGVKRYATPIRFVVLAVYVLSCVALWIYVLLGR